MTPQRGIMYVGASGFLVMLLSGEHTVNWKRMLHSSDGRVFQTYPVVATKSGDTIIFKLKGPDDSVAYTFEYHRERLPGAKHPKEYLVCDHRVFERRGNVNLETLTIEQSHLNITPEGLWQYAKTFWALCKDETHNSGHYGLLFFVGDADNARAQKILQIQHGQIAHSGKYVMTRQLVTKGDTFEYPLPMSSPLKRARCGTLRPHRLDVTRYDIEITGDTAKVRRKRIEPRNK